MADVIRANIPRAFVVAGLALPEDVDDDTPESPGQDSRACGLVASGRIAWLVRKEE